MKAWGGVNGLSGKSGGGVGVEAGVEADGGDTEGERRGGRGRDGRGMRGG